jgi:uncharacterized protein (DUF2062 family)
MANSEDPAATAGTPRRSFWHRWIYDPVARQLTQGVSPQKISLTLAVGSALALFPILGTTTWLCVLAGIVFGLNQAIIQGVNALCTFAYFPLILVFVRIGDALSGKASPPVNIPAMISLATHHPADFLTQFGVTALHAMLGWAVAAPLWIPIVYFIALRPLQAAARKVGPKARAS